MTHHFFYNSIYPPIDSTNDGLMVVLFPVEEFQLDDGIYNVEIKASDEGQFSKAEARYESDRTGSHGREVPPMLYVLDINRVNIFDGLYDGKRFSISSFSKKADGAGTRLRPMGGKA
ncbi:MAG: hypothetical protein AAF862_15570 [Pseudomonadota bacterium]